jgi:FixJ family two-component response regulator
MPIVVITADATRRTFSELFAAGADDFLTKPLDVKRLIEVVESVAAEKRERLDRRIG